MVQRSVMAPLSPDELMSATLVEAGAIGATINADLARAGSMIAIVDVAAGPVELTHSNGLSIETFDEILTVPVQVCLHGDLREAVDVGWSTS